MERASQLELIRLLDAVEAGTGVLKVDILSRSRRRPVSDARKIFCYLSYEKMDGRKSLHDIGAFIGKDHSTVIHNRDEAKNLITNDKKFAAQYQSVLQHCTGVLKNQDKINFNTIPQF